MRYQMPDGSSTDNQKVFLDAWHSLARPIEAMTGWRLTAFSPGLEFSGYGIVVSIPVVFAQALGAGYKKAVDGAGKHLKKQATLRVRQCRDCGVEVHTIGRGPTRLFCTECVKQHIKLRNGRRK